MRSLPCRWAGVPPLDGLGPPSDASAAAGTSVGASSTSAADAIRRRTDQATWCVMVPVYVPATAAAGMLTLTSGFQVAKLLPTPAVSEYAVRDVPRSWQVSS